MPTKPIKIKASDEPKRQQILKQYIIKDNVSQPIGEGKLSNKLSPGLYEIRHTNSGIVYEKIETKRDELLRFEDPTHKAILTDMDDFWKRKPHYENMKFLHNRALLMFGPPGSGKSCITRLATDDLVKKGDVVFTCRNIYDLVGALKTFREVEPERRCLVVMEDIDEMGEHALLQLLDGSDAVDNIMYLGTTNYIDRLPKRVLRPGRFDRKIEVNHPPATGREAYFRAKLGAFADDKDIKKLVDATDGFSFGHLRELLTSVFCLGHDINSVLKRLKGSGLEVSASLKKAITASVGVRKELAKNA
jgi:hypothetical protein